MNQEPDEYPDEEVEDWFRHPTTIARVKFWLTRQHEIQQVLFGLCSSSSDPQVRAKYAEYLAAVSTVATLTPKKKEVHGKR